MEEEIRSWLKVVLKENTEEFSLKILGNSEKGDGYAGDIVFVSLSPKNDKSAKAYDLVLKCSKRSKALREKSPVKQCFINEIYVYETVLPAFTQFQLEKGIQGPFNSVPKYYGSFVTESMENIVFENLKERGYSLWDKKKPLTRKHISMILEEYAKFHAVSIALKDQQNDRFEKLTNNVIDIMKQFSEISGFQEMFTHNIDDIADLLKGDLDGNILKTWRSLKEKIHFIIVDMPDEIDGLKVILHGDCWCNNFMFKHDPENPILPLKVAILDWQVSRYSSPILDLSYFLFAGISHEDVEDLDEFLDTYYEKLKFYVGRLHSRLDYSKELFLRDWRRYCKFGILMSAVVFKVCATEEDEVMDIGQVVEAGQNFTAAFNYDVKNKDILKNRAKSIVKYVVENHLI